MPSVWPLNEDAYRLLHKNNRVVRLSRQSLGVNKTIKQAQTKEGVPDHKVHTLVPTHTIRWGNQYLQFERNNLLLADIDPDVEKFRGTTRATRSPSWSRTRASRTARRARMSQR
jgi:hypothetical protein